MPLSFGRRLCAACSVGLAYFTLSTATALAAIPAGCEPKPVSEAELAGIVEIGSSGIKPAVFEVVRDEGAAAPQEKLRLLCLYPHFNTNLANPGQLADLEPKLSNILSEIYSDYGLRRENIEIVASSGVANIDNFEGQIRKILAKASSRKPADIGVVSASEECIFSLNWMALSSSGKMFLIDIGSKNTKGCDRFSGWELLPYGTKTFESQVKLEIDQSITGGQEEMKKKCDPQGDDKIRVFACASQISRKENITAILQSETSKPEKVFLIGGAPWAAATRMRPDSVVAKENVQFTLNEIEILRRDAVNGRLSQYREASYYKALSEEQKRTVDAEAGRAVGEIGASVFTTTQYISGLDIIITIMDHYRVGYRSAEFEFAAAGISAWPSWYLLTKINEGKPVPSKAVLSVDTPARDKFQRLYTDAAIAQTASKYGAACKKYEKAIAALVGDDSLMSLRRDTTEVRLMEIRKVLMEKGMSFKDCE